MTGAIVLPESHFILQFWTRMIRTIAAWTVLLAVRRRASGRKDTWVEYASFAAVITAAAHIEPHSQNSSGLATICVGLVSCGVAYNTLRSRTGSGDDLEEGTFYRQHTDKSSSSWGAAALRYAQLVIRESLINWGAFTPGEQ